MLKGNIYHLVISLVNFVKQSFSEDTICMNLSIH
jgi:hypothetical protein